MKGICNKCACVCVLDEVWEQYGCPACRAARAVKVVNGMSFHWHGPEFIREEEQTEVPRGCKMPLGDAAQIYELRRMFRL